MAETEAAELVAKCERWGGDVSLYQVTRRTASRVYVELIPGMDFGHLGRSKYIQAHEATPVRDMDHYAVVVAARKEYNTAKRQINDTARDKLTKAQERYQEQIK